MVTDPRKAVIAGGGIGGLSAALELQRAGLEVEVLERREDLAEVNTGFLLWSFAIRRLRGLGLGDGLEAIGRPMDRLVTKSWRGQTLSDLSLLALNQRVGAPSYDVHRAGLQRLLADAAGKEAIRPGHACAGVVADDASAGVVLEDGEHVTGDLLVGADGVNSVVRRHVAGEVPVDRDELGTWRGVAALGTEVVPEGAHIRVMGPRGLFGVGRLDERQVRWYAGGSMPEEPPATAAERKRQVEARFGDWAEPTPAVLAATGAEDVLFNDAPRAKPLRSWTRGPIALLGDAAHPTSPTLATGGGMAIEDAGVLAECVRAQPDVRAALHEYESRRRRTTARIQRESIGFMRVLGIRRRGALRARDLGFRLDWIQLRAIEHLMRGGEIPGL